MVANSAGVASPGSVSGVPVLALNVQVKGRSANLLVPSEPLPGFYRRSGRGRPAATRDGITPLGGSPEQVDPLVPVDLVCGRLGWLEGRRLRQALPAEVAG